MIFEKRFNWHFLQLRKILQQTLNPVYVISGLRNNRFVQSDMGCVVTTGIRFILFTLKLMFF